MLCGGMQYVYIYESREFADFISRGVAEVAGEESDENRQPRHVDSTASSAGTGKGKEGGMNEWMDGWTNATSKESSSSQLVLSTKMDGAALRVREDLMGDRWCRREYWRLSDIFTRSALPKRVAIECRVQERRDQRETGGGCVL